MNAKKWKPLIPKLTHLAERNTQPKVINQPNRRSSTTMYDMLVTQNTELQQQLGQIPSPQITDDSTSRITETQLRMKIKQLEQTIQNFENQQIQQINSANAASRELLNFKQSVQSHLRKVSTQLNLSVTLNNLASVITELQQVSVQDWSTEHLKLQLVEKNVEINMLKQELLSGDFYQQAVGLFQKYNIEMSAPQAILQFIEASIISGKGQ